MTNKTLYLRAIIASAILIFFDQFSKTLVLKNLAFISADHNNFLNIVFYKNTGLALGLPFSASPFYFIAALILFAIIFSRSFKPDKLIKNEILGIILILSGAIGNLIDRLKLGYIVDFISIKGILIFNMADVFIVGGALIVLTGYFPQITFGGKEFKKKIYVILFTVLGIILSFLVHAIIEMWYIDLLLSNFPKYGFGMNWSFWYNFHHIATILLFALGSLLGYFQGKYWWRILYEKR